MSRPTVHLRGTLASPHPWVWRTRLDRQRLPRKLAPGSLVRVLDGEGAPVGLGLVHPHVTIGLRIIGRDPDEAVDAEFFLRRLERARTLRRDQLRLPDLTNAYRLCHSEADGLSGLVVDVLGDVVRVEFFARGMALLEEPIHEALTRLFPDKRVVLRGNKRAGDIEGFRVAPRADEPREGEVREHGVRFKVDHRDGHKTGFFCDQRDNRAFLAGLAAGKRVLDCHTYSGGFALAAAVQGAREVTGVDIDEKAIALAKRNAKLNQVRVKFRQADAFAYLRELQRREQDPPELLILDPPKLARDAKEKEQALRTYRDLNQLGMERVADGGLLLTCSCSGSISEDDFLGALRSAAARSGRLLTIVRIAGAGPDHPVGLHVPETRYLKAVFARVDALPRGFRQGGAG